MHFEAQRGNKEKVIRLIDQMKFKMSPETLEAVVKMLLQKKNSHTAIQLFHSIVEDVVPTDETCTYIAGVIISRGEFIESILSLSPT